MFHPPAIRLPHLGRFPFRVIYNAGVEYIHGKIAGSTASQ